MNRRNFIKASSLVSVGAASLPLIASCNQEQPKADEKTETVVQLFELDEFTLEQLQELMRSGKHTSRSITEMYLNRIESIDQKGIRLNAVLETNPDALAIADQMDAERKSGKIRGPMHGIPVLIKDNIDTADKMTTTAGSLALEGHIAGEDAFIVKQLRASGAVLLGKTNLSEWANFRSTRSCSGWSSRGGQTKNPCVLDRSPCGSSSGSGTAVAANLCPVAIGTETDGSVISPASNCGIVGMKPTVGLWSRSGIIPISKTQDTAGPMARTVKDVAILLGILTGADNKDTATQSKDRKIATNYAQDLSTTSLQGKRIGFEKSFLEGNESVIALYKNAIEVLKKLGATVVEVELLNQTGSFSDDEFTVLKYEFKDGLNRYLASAGAQVKSLDEIIKFNKSHAKDAMPWFKQELLEQCQDMGGLDSKDYENALKNTLGTRKIIDKLMLDNKLDALCGTSIGPACCIDLVNGDSISGFYFCSPAAMAGYPHISVPMGTVHGLPMGFSFVSKAWDEQNLLNYAYAFEQATQKREKPRFLNSLNPT